MVARDGTESAGVEQDVAQLLGEQPVQQRREWVVDRVAWVVMALVVLTALAGLWGDGRLSSVQVTSADGRMTIAFDRFVRNQGSTVIQLQVESGAAIDGVVGIRVDSDYLLENQVRAITPGPSSVRADGGYYLYSFAASPGARLDVRFDLRPDADTWVAWHTARFGVATSPPVHIRQYVLP